MPQPERAVGHPKRSVTASDLFAPGVPTLPQLPLQK
ncbi:hypothetical protein CGRA01v4_10814 [Colletotrichum graminicola]|nr:hypothetical protein CGRA01v4_10814 [Colletotrichum graminicola]